MSAAAPLDLPGEYTFKIFGRQSATFVERVSVILARTFGTLGPEAVSVRTSSGERYLSVSVVVWVEERRQLEAAYADLKAEPEVLLYI
ncbi:MAG: DUF493 domain-containing protein [Candidatus Binatia bacterium]